MAAGREVDFSDASIAPAFTQLKDMKQQYNYVVLGLAGKTNKAELVGTGTDGLSGAAALLADDRVHWVLLKVLGADVQANVTSIREKWVFISWIGPKVGVMQKAKVGMQSKVVQAFFTGVSLAVVMDAGSQADLELEGMAKRLLACGGAHKPTKYIFGPGQEYSLVDAGLLGAAGPRAAFVSASDRPAESASPSPPPAAEAAPAEEAPPASE